MFQSLGHPPPDWSPICIITISEGQFMEWFNQTGKIILRQLLRLIVYYGEVGSEDRPLILVLIFSRAADLSSPLN